MKLLKILMTHIAPKDSETAIKEYVIAETHKDVFDYLYEKADYTYWQDKEWTNEEKVTVTFGHGESYVNDDWSDAFYGITRYDWEQVNSDLYQDQIDVLVELKIAKVVSGVAVQ